MFMPRTRIIAVGLLCLALASSTLQALPSIPPARAVSTVKSGDLVATVWRWIVSIVVPSPEPAEHAAKAAPVEQGSQLDPDGND
jgi:hypothetical protein